MQLFKNLIVGLTISILAIVVLLGTWLTVFAEGEVSTFSNSQKVRGFETGCAPPEGWLVYRVKSGDTLTNLADQLQIERIKLMSANCIEGDITPGDTIFLPELETSNSSPACGPPPTWVLRPLEDGELLSELAGRFGVDEQSLWHANCIDSHTILQPGMSIYVPPAQ